MAEIRVSNLDPIYIKEMDRKAEEISQRIGRNFSRNEYLKMLIQKDADFRLTRLKEDKFDAAVENLTLTLERQSQTLQNFINSNHRLFHLMANGIDIVEEDEDDEKN